MWAEGRTVLHGRQLLLQGERQHFLGFYLLFLLVLSNSGIRAQFLFALRRTVNMFCMHLKCIVKNKGWGFVSYIIMVLFPVYIPKCVISTENSNFSIWGLRETSDCGDISCNMSCWCSLLWKSVRPQIPSFLPFSKLHVSYGADSIVLLPPD